MPRRLSQRHARYVAILNKTVILFVNICSHTYHECYISMGSFEEAPTWAGKRGTDDAPNTQRKDRRKEEGDTQSRLVQLTAKLALTVARETAELASAVVETWEMDCEAPLASHGIKAGTDYNTQAQELKKRAEADEDVDTASLGPPHLVVWQRVVQKLGQDTIGEAKEKLERYYKEVVMLPEIDALGSSITIFRVKKNKGKAAKGKERCRMQFCFHPEFVGIRNILVGAIMAQGAKRKYGTAPRGALERDISKLLK